MTYTSSLTHHYDLPAVISDGAGGLYVLAGTTTEERLRKITNTGYPLLFWIDHYDTSLRLVRDVSAVFSLEAGSPGAGIRPSLTHLGDGSFVVRGNFASINGVAAAGAARIIPDAQPAATRLVNLSARTTAGTGDDTLIVGFVASGTGTRPVLARGIGPALGPMYVASFIGNPVVSLFHGSTVIASNDDWSSSANAAEIASTAARLGAFPLENTSNDAALLADIGAGNHSLHVAGAGGSTGIALAEVYDDDAPPADFTQLRIVNFSARARVGTGDATLIAGFAVNGPNTMRLLIRAVGPSLAAFGIASPLSDPTVTLYSGQTALTSQSGHDTNQSSDVNIVAAQVGAFALTSPADSAFVVTLNPGTYTVHVQSASGAAGVALVEIYELP
jgi:hypothetical protein